MTTSLRYWRLWLEEAPLSHFSRGFATRLPKLNTTGSYAGYHDYVEPQRTFNKK